MNNLVEIELAIKEGNLLWAYKELEFLYMQHNIYGINKKLTQVALNLNKYEEAKTLIYDYLDDYLNVDQDILLVAKIYCENYAYLELALLLKKINLNSLECLISPYITSTFLIVNGQKLLGGANNFLSKILKK